MKNILRRIKISRDFLVVFAFVILSVGLAGAAFPGNASADHCSYANAEDGHEGAGGVYYATIAEADASYSQMSYTDKNGNFWDTQEQVDTANAEIDKANAGKGQGGPWKDEPHDPKWQFSGWNPRSPSIYGSHGTQIYYRTVYTADGSEMFKQYWWRLIDDGYNLITPY